MTLDTNARGASGRSGAGTPALPIERFRPLAGGLDHPEGIAWDPKARVAYAGGEAGQIYRIGLDGSHEAIANTGGFVLGVAVDGDGLVYACDVARAAVLRIDSATGEVEDYARPASDEPAVRTPNWLAFDPAGYLYVTDSGDWETASGFIWRVAPGGEARVWTRESVLQPNGCCLSADGSALLVIETNLPGVVRIPIREDGTAGPREVVAVMPGTTPDGLATTEDGTLLVSCYRPDAIYSLVPGREPALLVEDVHAQTLGAPANVAFAGESLEILLTSNLARWHVSIGDISETGLRGAPLPRPSVRGSER